MPLNPKLVQSLFLQAARLADPRERAELLDRETAQEPLLRDRVMALLRAHDRRDSFLDQPVSPPLPDLLFDDANDPASPPFAGDVPSQAVAPSNAGVLIAGRYRLLEKIGEGGMGEVWVAEQRDTLRRRVAVKLIKAGMDSKSVLARFEAERQALAMMDHPNIARVFDGGTTDQGYPFFVMELVPGIPLTRYCDERKLTVRERLAVFTQICQAVQHAHQKGIIHRDLKPANILVTEMDGRSVPKVIDFGLAKALHGAEILTERTLYTVFGGVAGTPLYMAPEQVGINSLDVDTRTDVYALGAILYELLTGTTPLEAARLKAAQWAEICRLIGSEDPPRPSTRLSSSDSLPGLAASRQIEPIKLAKLIQGELDWIVLKALEKDRSRRYQTANALARDVERFLGNEPVEACPPSAAYRFRKLAQRHRRPLQTAAGVLVMLIGLVVVLIVSNVRVARERNQKADALKLAELNHQRAESNFLKARQAIASLVAQPAAGMDEWVQLSPQMRRKFAQTAVNYYQNLLAEGSVEPSLRYETAVGYRSLGFLSSRLNDHQEAETMLRQSIAILDPMVREYPDRAEYRQQSAWSRVMLAQALEELDKTGEALAAVEEAAATYEALIRQFPQNAEYPTELSWCYQKLLILKLPPEGVDEQEMQRRAKVMLLRIPPETMYAPCVHGRLGEFYARRRMWNEAIGEYRQGMELFQKQSPQSRIKRDLSLMLLEYETCLADVLIDSGDPNQQQEAIRILDRAVSERPRDARLLRTLSLTHARLNQWQPAADAAARSVKAAPHDVLSCYTHAILQLQAGHLDQYRLAARDMLQRFGDGRHEIIAARVVMACSLAPQGAEDPAALLHLADRAATNRDDSSNLKSLAEYRAGRFQTVLEFLRPSPDATSAKDLMSFAILSMAQHRLGHAERASEALAQAHAIDERIISDPARGQALPRETVLAAAQARLLLREADALNRTSPRTPTSQDSAH